MWRWHAIRQIVVPDVGRFLRYGLAAPRWAQRIWIKPSDCRCAVLRFPRSATGQVVPGDWDLATVPLDEIPKIRMALAHWRDGVPWAETGVYEYMIERIRQSGSLDGCGSLDDVVRRYQRLDTVFAEVRRAGRFRTREELPGRAIREKGGVYIHVGRDNHVIFGGGGCHRLVMAQVLNLPAIPAQLGVLHAASLRSWRALARPPLVDASRGPQ